MASMILVTGYPVPLALMRRPYSKRFSNINANIVLKLIQYVTLKPLFSISYKACLGRLRSPRAGYFPHFTGSNCVQRQCTRQNHPGL